MVDPMMRFLYAKILVSDNFQEIHYLNKNEREFVYSCNSTLFQLLLNIIGRANFGDGLIKLQTFEVASLILLNPENIKITGVKINTFNKFISRDLNSFFEELGFNRNELIRDQIPNPLPDRKELDDIIFYELGLSNKERNEVYWSVAELVKQRLDKAASR